MGKVIELEDVFVEDFEQEAVEVAAIKRLTKDQREAYKSLGKNEARFLVDQYYQVQKMRITCQNQIRSMQETQEPVHVLMFTFANYRQLETNCQAALDIYSKEDLVGQWARKQVGVGPVIAAGLLAHFDIERAPNYGHFLSFAGLNPTKKWEKGKKRPWNADLKSLCCYKLGESFVKSQNSRNSFYGPLYVSHKEKLKQRNENGDFKEAAAQALEEKKYRKETEAYKSYVQGMLPKAHIHRRAVRFSVKIFISHLHQVWFELHYGKPHASVYPHAMLGHEDIITPPAPYQPLS